VKRNGLPVSEEPAGRFGCSVLVVPYFPRELTLLPIFALNDFKKSGLPKLAAAPETFFIGCA
jgi:hypothetical protein